MEVIHKRNHIAALLVLLLLLLVVGPATAFVTPSSVGMSATTRTMTTDLQMTVLVYKGKKKNFPAGSPLSRAAAALGVPVKYSCKK